VPVRLHHQRHGAADDAQLGQQWRRRGQRGQATEAGMRPRDRDVAAAAVAGIERSTRSVYVTSNRCPHQCAPPAPVVTSRSALHLLVDPCCISVTVPYPCASF